MIDAQPALALYFFAFLGALAVSLGLTFYVRERARTAGLFDPVEDRKLHTKPIPRIGGVAIVLTVALVLSAIVVAFGPGALGMIDGDELLIVLGGALAIHLLGLWDDVRSIRARWKFVIQIVIAAAVYFAGVRMTLLSLPFAGTIELGPLAGLLFTVLWFVGITNAFNLIDGLDGLAAGAAMFALTTMFVVAGIYGQVGPAVVTAVVAGATLGFLFYNFHPASIFLGDGGSLFLGFMLAGIGLLSSQKSPTVVAVAIPVVSLGLPVVDTALAIFRRFLRGKPIFSPDAGHIHHRLLSLGHSPKKAALLLYGACATLALMAMLLVTDAGYVALVLLMVGLAGGFAVQRLRFAEFEELGRFVAQGLRPRTMIRRNVRLREASRDLAMVDGLDPMFEFMGRTFAAEEFARAEVRLRRSFLLRTPDGAVRDRRLEDDVPVWTWCRNGISSPAWWEIKLPLIDSERQTRFGTLVLWQEEGGVESLAHINVIAGDLRGEVQAKLVALWHLEQVAREAPACENERIAVAVLKAQLQAAQEDDEAESGRQDRLARATGGRQPAA